MSANRLKTKSTMLFKLFTNLIAFVLILNVSLYFLQPGMIFLPYGTMDNTPSDRKMPYEDIHLQHSGGQTIHGWYIPAQNARLTLLFFHGNAGNISHRIDSLQIFHQLGLNVFIIDYRGYGKSAGSPGEQNMYEDAQLAWKYLSSEKNVKPEHAIFFGRSLGGAIATRLASEIQPGALILESVFSSINDMASNLLPGLSSVVFLRYQFNNHSMIKNYQGPLLLLHSPDDEIIPYAQGKKVFLAANKPKKMVLLKGDHNGGFLQSQPDYQQHLKRFLLTYSNNLK